MYTSASRSQVWIIARPSPSVTSRDPAFAPSHRVAFATPEGRLALESEGVAPLVPVENIEQDVMRRAILRGEAILKSSLDSLDRTIVLAYLPPRPATPDGTDARAPAVFLTSLVHLGDAVREIARRRFGMTRLQARVCAALVETGTLRRGTKICGVTYQTAQSEMADAMHAAGVGNQSALICKLAGEWLSEPLDSEQAAGVLMQTFGLIARDAKVASLIAAGLGREQAGARLGVSKWAIKSSCTRIFDIVGVAKAPELTRVVIDALLASRLAVSLSGR